MGLALPALGGELLPERTAHDAAVLLTIRHAGIALALAIDVGTLIALASLLIAAGHSSVGRVATARVVADENPSGWRGLLFGVYRGVRAARTYPSRAATVMAAGAAFQLVLCAAVWAEGQIVGIEGLTLLAVLALFPPVAIAQNLPIGLGGLGVREGDEVGAGDTFGEWIAEES